MYIGLLFNAGKSSVLMTKGRSNKNANCTALGGSQVELCLAVAGALQVEGSVLVVPALLAFTDVSREARNLRHI